VREILIGVHKSKGGRVTGYHLASKERGNVRYISKRKYMSYIFPVEGLVVENGKIDDVKSRISRYPFSTESDMDKLVKDYKISHVLILDKYTRNGSVVGYRCLGLDESSLIRSKIGSGLKANALYMTDEQFIGDKFDVSIVNGKIVDREGKRIVSALDGSFNEVKLVDGYSNIIKKEDEWTVAEFVYVVKKHGCKIGYSANGVVAILEVVVPDSGTVIPVLKYPRGLESVRFTGGEIKIGSFKVESMNANVTSEEDKCLVGKCILGGGRNKYLSLINLSFNAVNVEIVGEETQLHRVSIHGRVKLVKVGPGVQEVRYSFDMDEAEIQAVDLTGVSDAFQMTDSFIKYDKYNKYNNNNNKYVNLIKVKPGNVRKFKECFIDVNVQLYGWFSEGIEYLSGFSHVVGLKEADFSGCKKLERIAIFNCAELEKIDLPESVELLNIYGAFSNTKCKEVRIKNRYVTLSKGAFNGVDKVRVGGIVCVGNCPDGTSLNLFIENSKDGEVVFPSINSVSIGGIDIHIEEGAERILSLEDKSKAKYTERGRITKLRLPSTLKSINSGVFKGLRIENINIEDTALKELKSNTFKDTEIKYMLLPKTMEEVCSEAISGNKVGLVYFNKDIKRLDKTSYGGSVAIVHQGSMADKVLRGVKKIYVDSYEEALRYITTGDSIEGAEAKVMLVETGTDMAKWARDEEYRGHISLIGEIQRNLESDVVGEGNVSYKFPDRVLDFDYTRLGLIGKGIQHLIDTGESINKHPFEKKSDVFMNLLNFIMGTTESYAGMFTSKIITMESEIFHLLDEYYSDIKGEALGNEELYKSTIYKDSRSAIVIMNIKAGVPLKIRHRANSMYAIVAVENGVIRYATIVEDNNIVRLLSKLGFKGKGTCGKIVIGDTYNIKDRELTVQLKRLPTKLKDSLIKTVDMNTIDIGNKVVCFESGRVLTLDKAGVVKDIEEFKDVDFKYLRMPQYKAMEYFNIINGKEKDKEVIEFERFSFWDVVNKYAQDEIGKSEVRQYLVENETKYKIRANYYSLIRGATFLNRTKKSHGKIKNTINGDMTILVDKDYADNAGYTLRETGLVGTLSRFNIDRELDNLDIYTEKVLKNKPVKYDGEVYSSLYSLGVTFGIEWDNTEYIRDTRGHNSSVGSFVDLATGIMHLFYMDGFNRSIRLVGKITKPEEYLEYIEISRVKDLSRIDKNRRAELTGFLDALLVDREILNDIRECQEANIRDHRMPYLKYRISPIFEWLGL